MKSKHKSILHNESGVALIIAIIMILVMSALASAISFVSNNDFVSMANYKKGQEAFLAAESCATGTRDIIENEGPGILFEGLRSEINDQLFVRMPIRSAVDTSIIGTDVSKWKNPMCRTGHRFLLNSNDFKNPRNFLITNRKKAQGNVKHFSIGEFNLHEVSFVVTGKDSSDEDKADTKSDINTGIEIITGVEIKTLGGTNEY